VESAEQRVTRLMAKTEYPYELVCIPMPNLQVGPYPDKTCNAQYNGTFQVYMRIYSGEPHSYANMLYERETLWKLDQMSDNELEYQLWQMALDCKKVLYSNPYYPKLLVNK
jgi:hypothetical protein